MTNYLHLKNLQAFTITINVRSFIITALFIMYSVAGSAQTAFKSLNYLYNISGTKTASGQHNREPNSNPAQSTNQIFSTTGKYPALWSGDFLFAASDISSRQTMINQAKVQWNAGALINIMFHACPPTQPEPCAWDGGVVSDLSDAQWNELITNGTSLNNNWKARLDLIAGYLQDLKNNGVEVMFRPFHEMNQGVFWWAGRTGSNGTSRLFQITRDYLVNTKGLTNLIWVWNLQDFGSLSSDLNSYDPGGNYWDVLALDMYSSDGQGYTTAKYNAMVSKAGSKPIAIGECQLLPTSSLLTSQPRWTFFMGWSELVFSNNTTAAIQNVYGAGNVITRDEMPGWTSTSQFKTVGYFPSWVGAVSDIQFSKLTHINYAFVLPTASGGLQAVENPAKLQSLVSAAHAANVKVSIAIGGWNDGNDSAFETLAGNATSRTNFVNSVVNFINQYGLDGADIDWEYPDSGTSSNNYSLLMQQLSSTLHANGKLLTAAVVAVNGASIQNNIFGYVDFLNLMAYDGGGANHSTFDFAVQSLNYWKGRGLPANKAILGVPFYGRSSTEFVDYRVLLSRGADPFSDTFSGIGYNGINTIKSKTNLAFDQGAGIMIWELSEDVTNQNSLLSAINQVVVSRTGTVSAPVVSSSGAASGSIGLSFNYSITASNSPASYGASSLPPGLSVNTSTGVISGTPSALGTYNTTVSATNSAGTGTKVVAITIGNPPPCAAPYINITSTAPTVDTSIDAVWTNANIGSINNVTLGARPADFTGSQWRALYDNTNLYILVEVKDASRFNDSGGNWWEDDVVEIFIDGNNSKGTSYDGVNDFQYGFRYNDAIVKVGGSSVNRTTGVTFTQHNITNGYNIEVRIPWSTIGVTPVAGNKIGFDISVDDDDNAGIRDAQMTAFATTGVGYTNPSVFGSVTLCNAATSPVPIISNTSLPTGTVNSSYNATITASNSPTSFGATGLPAGLSVNTSTGVISGTPTASGTFTVTLSATNASGTGTKQLSLVVNPAGVAPVVSNASLPTGTVGTAYNTTIIASNNPTGFNATSLPAGLSVNTSTGVISGTPTASGTFTVTLSATNASGTGTKQLSLVVNPAGAAPVVSNTSLPTGTIGTAYNTTITATNNPTSRNATGLPAGLSVNTSTGMISGTPTASGTFTVTLSATNASGTGTKQLSLVVNPAGDPPGIVTCLRTSGTITVNGTLSETNWNSVINKSITKSISGSPNNTATFGVLWDNTNLYVGVRVLDANLHSDSPNTWDDDAVEVYIDANNNKLTTYDGRDNQIIKNYNKSTVFTKLAVTGLQHGWAAITGGYSVELAIPWSQLGVAAPAAGQNYGFDVGYDDDDNAGTRDHQAVWNGTINNYQNTSAFGTLTLSGTVAARMVAEEAEVVSAESVKVVYWPNPVDDEINIITDGSYDALEIMDVLGRSFYRDSNISGKTNIKLDMTSAAPGINLIRLSGKYKIELIRVIKNK